MENLKKVENLLNEIYDNIVSQSTPAASYFSGEFERIVEKNFDDREQELSELISNFSEEESAAYLDVAEKCADRYEKNLTDMFFNIVGLERD